MGDQNDAVFKRRLGRKIVYYRTQMGMTQDELAAKAELSRTALGKIERGIVLPKYATLVLLEKALGLQENALVELTETEGEDDLLKYTDPDEVDAAIIEIRKDLKKYKISGKELEIIEEVARLLAARMGEY